MDQGVVPSSQDGMATADDHRLRAVSMIDIDGMWRPASDASIIHESCGAGTFRAGAGELTLLRYPELPTVVLELEGGQCIRWALISVGIPARNWNGYVRALADLARIGFLVPVDRAADQGRFNAQRWVTPVVDVESCTSTTTKREASSHG